MSLRLYFCFLVLYASISFPTKCFGNICLPKDHVAFFIFGDSIVDVGNNNYITTYLQANFFPYGETFFKYPLGELPMAVSFQISLRANLPLIPPYLYPGSNRYSDGANFASTGAGVLAETRRGLVIDLNTQLHYFKNMETLLKHKRGEEESKTLLVKAVYLICIGSNDYFVPFTTNSSVLKSLQKNTNSIGYIYTLIYQEIYKKGGRKYVFLGLPPAGCAPSIKALIPGNTGAGMEELTALAKLHNRALSKSVKIWYVTLSLAFIAHNVFYYCCTQYFSFTEGKISCCGSGPYRGIPSCGERSNEYELWEKVTFCFLTLFCSSYRKGLPTICRVNLEWNSQYHRSLQSQSIV
ncbi:gdsl esterase/lipase 5 [Quercus suber]|uniref:Gdsl esterase/lipase 5 n=1 Tax=Quercus suber TaxID=58331 RepID=A0AAW0L2M7_QUESU